MVGIKKETKDLLLSITKNWEKPVEKTHTEPQKKLEVKLTQPKETFSLNPQSGLVDAGR